MALRSPDKYEEPRKTLRTEFEAEKYRYGYWRLHAKLEMRGWWSVSENIIRRPMKEKLLAVFNTKRRKYNSYMGEISPAVENILRRDFHADRPNMKWLTAHQTTLPVRAF